MVQLALCITGLWAVSESRQEQKRTYLKVGVFADIYPRSEMSNFSNGTLTDIVLDRLFAERQSYKNTQSGESELDYPGYLDFVIAIENNQTPESIAFFFRLLDIHYQVSDMLTFPLGLYRSVHSGNISWGSDQKDEAARVR